ncbi:GtrA family protein [Plasticicumulans acidivorans]|uniref:Putative flippase GtrA n=1 Tax=Plasticicumulans acidivorans TaxID=886464 RepID=A0A317N1Y6_9GAMM|nr:GtrA family protein [Plasticicumulans acidivorans]PWV65918.1 putative flippase GtrA [Plasticicumulans acidivorans]
MATTTELWRFGVVGVIGLLIDIGVLYLALAAGCGFYLGRALSFVAAASGTWLCNRLWTFREQRSGRTLWAEWLHYMSLMLVGGALNYALYAALIALSASVRAWPVLAVCAGSLAGMIANFLSAKWLVFRHRH